MNIKNSLIRQFQDIKDSVFTENFDNKERKLGLASSRAGMALRSMGSMMSKGIGSVYGKANQFLGYETFKKVVWR